MTEPTPGDTPRTIALLGSSGGNLRAHGGDDPASLIAELQRQAASAGISVTAVQFVAASSSLDSTRDDTRAQLWTLDADGGPQVTASGTLVEVNGAARAVDRALADRIRSGAIDGLVLASSDPKDVNSAALDAAVAAGIPVAGTGGTSIADAQSLGVRFVAVSGTTGTSSRTRAVSAVTALAREWGSTYRPDLGTRTATEDTEAEGPAWKRFSLRGIMIGSLPAFIALALVLAFSKVPVLSGLTPVFDALIAGLPVVVAAVAARRLSGLGEVGLVAGVIAGVLAAEGGLLGGLVAGTVAGLLAPPVLRATLRWRFPATTSNILVGAVAGLVPGLLVFYLLAPVTAWLGEGVKSLIDLALATNPVLAGALAGLAMWPAIIGGVYHSVILPIVLLEMGEKGVSFLGAVDMVAMVSVSFGIMLANLAAPRTSGERALAASGGVVNLGFGTFVEAAYPFMFGDRRVFAGALVAATAGGAVTGAFGAEATAYLPMFAAPAVANTPFGMALAMATSLAVAFAWTLLVNLSARRAARPADAGPAEAATPGTLEAGTVAPPTEETRR